MAKKSVYNQVCLWEGCLVKNSNPPYSEKEFVSFMKKEFGVRVKYLEEVLTKPDMKNGKPVRGTGGRNDLLFSVHEDDVMKFAVIRLSVGIRWIEDVMSRINNSHRLYDNRLANYCTWNEENLIKEAA